MIKVETEELQPPPKNTFVTILTTTFLIVVYGL